MSGLCVLGCGFYGSTQFDGKCSHCYKQNKSTDQVKKEVELKKATEDFELLKSVLKVKIYFVKDGHMYLIPPEEVEQISTSARGRPFGLPHIGGVWEKDDEADGYGEVVFVVRSGFPVEFDIDQPFQIQLFASYQDLPEQKIIDYFEKEPQKSYPPIIHKPTDDESVIVLLTTRKDPLFNQHYSWIGQEIGPFDNLIIGISVSHLQKVFAAVHLAQQNK